MSRRSPLWAICVCLADCGFGRKVGCRVRGRYRASLSESQMARSAVMIYALVGEYATFCDVLGNGCGGFFV
jgi:hypothetical protein